MSDKRMIDDPEVMTAINRIERVFQELPDAEQKLRVAGFFHTVYGEEDPPEARMRQGGDMQEGDFYRKRLEKLDGLVVRLKSSLASFADWEDGATLDRMREVSDLAVDPLTLGDLRFFCFMLNIYGRDDLAADLKIAAENGADAAERGA
jgi:hypothetical protein